jgi:hypothetical protein
VSWHFSRALEEAYLADDCSDGELYAQLSSIPTAPASSCSGRTKATLSHFPFGTMYVPSVALSGAALLTWYRAGFRARTSAAPGKILIQQRKNHKGSTASVVGFGLSSQELLPKYVLDSRLLRTLPCLSKEGWTAFLEAWPKWGTMRNGVVSPRHPWVLLIREKESSFWHVTPTARDYKGASDACLRSLDTFPGFLHKTQLWHQTPTAVLRSGVYHPLVRLENGKHILTVYDNYSPRLKGSSPGHFCTFPNPECSEAVMGWPISWTAATPLATAKFRSWLRRHGVF